VIVRDRDLGRVTEQELVPRWRKKRASSSVRDSFFMPLFFNFSSRRGTSFSAWFSSLMATSSPPSS